MYLLSKVDIFIRGFRFKLTVNMADKDRQADQGAHLAFALFTPFK